MTTHTARSAAAVRTGLVAAMAAAVAVGSYGYFSAAPDGGSTSGNTTGTGPSTSGNGETTAAAAPFTTADAGSCLTWDIAADGTVSSFQQADCVEEHRFEVSARENLATYPSSEFGANASMPDLTRQAQLRQELCLSPTLRYLNGRFDPGGRYSIAPILPPAEAWAAGDRTMLCGLQSTDLGGTPVLTTGAVAEQDQAVVMEPGSCVYVDESRSLRTVDCAEDHSLETTLIVDLAPVFPEGVPSVEDQDNHLRDVCTDAAIDYLGEEENLYQSTLQPYWGTLQEGSWAGGSRSVNCSLVFADEEGGFATLNGSARDGREGFTINGEPPAEQPERNPLREPAA